MVRCFYLYIMESKRIGIFDSGFGGLTVFKSIYKQLPQYDYVYLGDTARAPYGNRTFQSIHEYTRECVRWLFQQDCELVVLACNTASAKALRTIQQNDLKRYGPSKRVLGVIRPTAEVIGNYTFTNKIGVLGTKGTDNIWLLPNRDRALFSRSESLPAGLPPLGAADRKRGARQRGNRLFHKKIPGSINSTIAGY